MKIAIPIANGTLNMHFGHCASFTIVDVDPKTKEILNTESIEAPAHEPGLLPRWLSEKKVEVIIAGGMGQHAQRLFASYSIKVVVGAPSNTVEKLVEDYLNDNLKTGVNFCDH